MKKAIFGIIAAFMLAMVFTGCGAEYSALALQRHFQARVHHPDHRDQVGRRRNASMRETGNMEWWCKGTASHVVAVTVAGSIPAHSNL